MSRPIWSQADAVFSLAGASMSLTPMMKQYREAKRRYPGMLLLFRMGDFFELFEEDAEVASRILGLTLTSRDKTVPMAGIPHHALDRYLGKLIEAGFRVAICDQVEDASQAKGLVRREVTRIVTPGTITEDELLDPRRSNYLLAVVRVGRELGLAWVDPSTGAFAATDSSNREFDALIGRLAPAECIVPDTAVDEIGSELRRVTPETTVTPCPDWTFSRDAAHEVLRQQFGVATFAGLGFRDDDLCLNAAGALVTYLGETLKARLEHLQRLRCYRQEEHVIIDEFTRRSLELTHTLRENDRSGSLLSVLDRTVTAMGARLLHEWLTAPLADRESIEARLDAVEELTREHSLRSEVRELLRQAYDLQRLTSRIATGRATPRDLAAVAATLRLLPRLKAKLAGRSAQPLTEIENRIGLFVELRSLLERALVDSPPVSPREGGLIRPGFDSLVDELRDAARGGKNWLAQYQQSQIERTGIPNLKVGFNRVHGYYIEITHAHRDKVPADYQRRQTLKNAERYITPELKQHEEKVLGAEEKLCHREYELFLSLRDQVAQHTGELLRTAGGLAELDVFAGLADLAVTRNYSRPRVTDKPVIHIREGRHPVLDELLPPGTVVPNDTQLSPEEGFVWLITGPNMAGKSVYIRQVALLTLMAHMGSFVPAAEMTFGLVDRIFTRVGASDELGRGRSTFLVEMTEAANILNNATERSLVILDEIGRGTSTYDGVSLAWSITEYLHNEIGCRTLFATHYHELAQLAETLPGLRNYNAQVQETDEGIVFLHRIVPGSIDKSYGIHVAKLAGIPADVIERAQEVLADLEQHHVEAKRRPLAIRRRKPKPPRPSLPLFDDDTADRPG